MTLADELRYVEKYLRLEQARFGDRLHVRLEVAPEILHGVRAGAVAPAAGRERGAPRRREQQEGGTIEIVGHDLGPDVELRVQRRRAGHGRPAAAALAGRGGGIGLANVDGRLRHDASARATGCGRVSGGRGHDGGR